MRRRIRALAVGATVIVATTMLAPTGVQASPHLATSPGQAPGAVAPEEPTRSEAEAAATRQRLGLASGEQLHVRDIIVDDDRSRHVRYDRTYRGLPVVGGDLVAHFGPAGTLRDVDVASTVDLGTLTSISPRVNAPRAKTLAAAGTALRPAQTRPKLMVWAVDGTARLAWRAVVVRGSADPIADRRVSYIDATTGEELASWSLTPEARGSGHGYHNGHVPVRTARDDRGYVLRDDSRGGHRTLSLFDSGSGPFHDADNVWGDGTLRDPKTSAVDVHYGAATTWDFFSDVLGRLGIRDDGVASRSYVVRGEDYVNAFWDERCFCAVFGDGDRKEGFAPLTSLDVVGHELAHGVTTATANLLYEDESGGLNEATSDIFGTAVEFYADNRSDPADYRIGEEVVLDGGFLRRMDRPAADGRSPNCYYPGIGYRDVHFSSAPANHFFYLLAEGSGRQRIGGLLHNSPSCGDMRLAGIGRAAAVRLWYRALTVYMTSTIDYVGARDATLKAARDLFGPESQRCAQVARAWNAVAVDPGFETCAAPSPNGVTDGGFEKGGSGWSQSRPVVTNEQPALAHNGDWYAALGGLGTAHTDALEQPVEVPSFGPAQLSFWVNIETAEPDIEGYDLLRVHVRDGTDTRTVARLTNGDGWATPGWQFVSVDASRWRGERVTLRFTASEDNRRATTFFIDDVALRHRTTVRGPREYISAEVMLTADEAPNADRWDWYWVRNDRTRDPESPFDETTLVCKDHWYQPLNARSYRDRYIKVTHPRRNDTDLSQDVVVFSDAATARRAYRVLHKDLVDCEGNRFFDVHHITDLDGPGQGTVWHVDGDNLEQTEILVQRGRAISVVGVYNDPKKNANYDPAWAVPTAYAALTKLEEYA